MTTQRSNTNSRPAFTLIEMIVAVAITAVMILLINQLFAATTRSVSRGIEAGDLISTHRTISDRLTRDAKRMIGPMSAFEPDGITPNPDADTSTLAPLVFATPNPEALRAPLVILMDTVGPGPGPVRNFPMPDPRIVGSEYLVPPGQLRADQIIFFTRPNPEEASPMTPDTNTGYAPLSITGAGAKVSARVSWGHLQQTNPDGTDTGQTLATATEGNPDYRPLNWHLGRQALILPDHPTTAPYDPDIGNHYVSEPAVLNALAYGAATTGLTNPFAVNPALWLGYTDFSRRPLAHDPAVANPDATVTRLDPIIAPNASTGYFTDGLSHTAGSPNYVQQALKMTFGVERLRTNVAPVGDTFAAWKIAQMHAIIAPYCSEFEVTFAGDANGDGQVDTDSDGNGWPDNGTGNLPPTIVWYGSKDRFGDFIFPRIAGALTNYQHVGFDPGLADFDYDVTGSTVDLDGTYQPMVSGATTPALNAALPGIINNADVAFVWRHDYPNNWPYMIRVRYRLHDMSGRFRSTQYVSERNSLLDLDDDGVANTNGNPATFDSYPISGKWFEVIIPVNRRNLDVSQADWY